MKTEIFNQSEVTVCNRSILLVVVLMGAVFFSVNSKAAAAQENNDALSAAAQARDSGLASPAATNQAAVSNYLLAASELPTPTPAPRAQQQRAPLDFNGDNKTDYVVARSADPSAPSFWYINNGSGVDAKSGQQWGSGVNIPLHRPSKNNTGDYPVPADYDGDGKTDFAVWRAGAQAYFYILQSATNTFRAEAFGQAGDDPSVVGDFDGDGKTDLAVYRVEAANGAQNFFYYRPSQTPGVNFRSQPWGAARYGGPSGDFYDGDFPYPADYDGDGKADFVVQRAVGATVATTFFILKSSGGVESVYWGLPNDALIPGDYDGDGRTDLCVRRFTRYFIRYASGATQTFVFGTDELSVPGDYDGDGRTDIALRNRRSGAWAILPTTGAPPFYFYWGQGISQQGTIEWSPANYAVQQPVRFT